MTSTYQLDFSYDDTTPQNLLLYAQQPFDLSPAAVVEVDIQYPPQAIALGSDSDLAFSLEQDYSSAGSGVVSIQLFHQNWTLGEVRALGGHIVLDSYGTAAAGPASRFLFAMLNSVGSGSNYYPTGVLTILSRQLVTKRGASRGYFAPAG